MRRRSRLPSDCRGAFLSGAWLVNCLESRVVEGAVSKMAPPNHMLISEILLRRPSLGLYHFQAQHRPPHNGHGPGPHLAQKS